MSVFDSPHSLDIQSNSAAMPGPTLEFASICLQNALFLLPPLTHSEGDNGDNDDIPTVDALPGPPIKGQSILDLRSGYCADVSLYAIVPSLLHISYSYFYI